jgi:hypothetical protein
MVDVFLTVAARIRAALNARWDLMLETLGLRHQLGVLARSDRRFRPGDRLFWLCLRRFWHRWKEALVLVEPATVARWHRQGFAECWRRRSLRRAGRPRIDSEVQSLIRRMVARLRGAAERALTDENSRAAQCRMSVETARLVVKARAHRRAVKMIRELRSLGYRVDLAPTTAGNA